MHTHSSGQLLLSFIYLRMNYHPKSVQLRHKKSAKHSGRQGAAKPAFQQCSRKNTTLNTLLEQGANVRVPACCERSRTCKSNTVGLVFVKGSSRIKKLLNLSQRLSTYHLTFMCQPCFTQFWNHCARITKQLQGISGLSTFFLKSKRRNWDRIIKWATKGHKSQCQNQD